MPTPLATSRLEARISADLYQLIKRAAEIQGRSVTDFVTSVMQKAAQQAIEEAEILRLSRQDQECFAQALLSPPPPAEALTRAFARRQAWIEAQ